MPDIYKNAPLARAVFQARFPGELAIELARPRIQAALRGAFPKLFVPNAVPGVAPATQPYLFKSSNESESFEIALNSFAYTTTQYPGYARFRQIVLAHARIFSDAVPEVEKLNRVGLRYINRMPILRESKAAAIPLRDYLNVGLELPASIPGANLTELNSAFTVQMDGGQLRVVLKIEEGAGPAEPEVLVLDFDFGQLEDLHIRNLELYLDRAHDHTKRVFTDLIAQEYFPVMRGELQ